jgi:hypothetical protein
MACDELLVHTHDAARGLELPFAPPPALARATLERLFPWAPPDTDPRLALLWANGRIDLPGQPRQVDWRWHCAPWRNGAATTRPAPTASGWGGGA